MLNPVILCFTCVTLSDLNNEIHHNLALIYNLIHSKLKKENLHFFNHSVINNIIVLYTMVNILNFICLMISTD